MAARIPSDWRDAGPADIGTLWRMKHDGHHARCALIAWPRGGWGLRVVIDDRVVLSERVARGEAAFALADRWKGQMASAGWRARTPMVPAVPIPSLRLVSRRGDGPTASIDS